jgi:dolichol kinase
MISLFIALTGVALLVVTGEYLRRVHLLHAEVTRKFIHISVAAFAASWPFFMEWNEVYLISLLMFVGILFSRFLHLFGAIHGVKRRTWGELFFAMSIGICAVFGQSPWAFAAAMLVMGIADGMAALVGTLIDGTHDYKVFGHRKSREGTITFFVCTIVIILVCASLGNLSPTFLKVLSIAGMTAIIENISIAGTDNLFVPLAVVLLISS